MLKITELRNAMELAESFVDACSEEDFKMAEKEHDAACKAFFAELDKARAVKAQYEAIGDDQGIGEVNAGDTFDYATYGTDRHISTEYWQLAIDSFQMFRAA